MNITNEWVDLKSAVFNICDDDKARYKRLADGALIEKEVVIDDRDEITMEHVMDFIKAIRPRQFGKPTKVLVVKKSYLESLMSEYGISKETLEIALNCTIVINEYIGEDAIIYDREELRPKFNLSHYYTNRASRRSK